MLLMIGMLVVQCALGAMCVLLLAALMVVTMVMVAVLAMFVLVAMMPLAVMDVLRRLCVGGMRRRILGTRIRHRKPSPHTRIANIP